MESSQSLDMPPLGSGLERGWKSIPEKLNE
jgi:hypothetical protein